MLDTIYSQIGAAIVLVVCGLAVWKGDRLEQWGAAVCFMAWLATILVQDQPGGSRELAYLALDTVVLAALGALAWKSERSWPVWAAACQAITVAVHLTKLLDFRIPSFAYVSAWVASSYGVLLALLIGVIIVWREREALRPR